MNIGLFILSAFLWASAWFPIKLQLGGKVTPLWSLAYRFGIATIILLVYCIIKKYPLSLDKRQHFWFFIQSLLLFFVPFFLFYLASSYFASGIIATLFASVSIMNIINSRIFLKTPIEIKSIIGSVIGILGLCSIIFTEFIQLEDKSFWFIINGLLLTFGATLSVSWGQIVFIANLERGVPIVQTNIFGFFYSTVLFSITALVLGQMPSFDTSPTYVLSLAYLALVGTAIGFLVYFYLAERIGLDKAAYVFVLTPVIAMVISGFFEKLIWTPTTIIGASLVLIGNVIVMTKRLPARRQS